MEHPNCRELLDMLSEYVDGELEARLCNEIEQHMVGCQNCRIVVDSLRKTVSLYQMIQDETAMPEDMRERLYHCLELDEFLDRS
jgi:predicted anti-sigma-YlaC factor YlaD